MEKIFDPQSLTSLSPWACFSIADFSFTNARKEESPNGFSPGQH
ncbi:hypothetical protein [Prosthecobacter sp.]